MVHLILQFRVFFLPSLFEGLPLTGVEAQAMGLPSILSASVTDELVYTDLVKYVSLDEPIEEWEKAFKKRSNGFHKGGHIQKNLSRAFIQLKMRERI